MTLGMDRSTSGQIARVFRGLSSGAFSVAVRVLLQLVQVPLLLSLWGTERFGEWTMLLTVPVYLSLTGAGVSTVGGNFVCTALAEKRDAEARSGFRASWMLVSLSNLTLITLAALLLPLAHAQGWLCFKTITALDAATTTGLLVLLVAMRLQCAVLLEIPLRARGRYAQAQLVETLTQLVESAMLVACVYFSGSVSVTAAGLALIRGMLLVGLVMRLLLSDRLLIDGEATSTAAQMQKLLKPSVLLLLFPVAQAIQFEGVTLAIGYWLGVVSVSLYVTMRTMARTADMLLILGYNLLMVEAAYLTGKDGAARKRIILGLGTIVCFAVAGAATAATALIGWVGFHKWTAGRLEWDSWLFIAVTAIAVVRSAYIPSSALVIAANQHSTLSLIHVAAASAALAVATVAGVFGAPLVVMAWCPLVGEIILGCAAISMASALVGRSMPRCVVDGLAKASTLPSTIFRPLWPDMKRWMQQRRCHRLHP